MLLDVKDLVKQYGNGVRANDGITLSVDRGEVYGLLGPNGAGKSTLVKQIVALLTPTGGTIELDGRDISLDPAFARKACSFQPQTDVPIDGLTPVQAIELIGRMRGGDRDVVRNRCREMIDALEIGEWAKKPGQQLSGGVRRLVGYCMAAVTPGDLVILDEPTNDIDPLRRRHLWRQIKSLTASGTAVLLVTHNVLEAERAVDRLAIIDRGKVLGSGTPGSLKGNGASSLRLEVMLEPGAGAPDSPAFLKTAVVGRRLRAVVDGESVQAAVEWARALQAQGIAEEFSLSPISLEDVYVRMIGRPDALDDSPPAAPGHRRREGR
jgi:ABC-2 type transport system ATP-binding protein